MSADQLRRAYDLIRQGQKKEAVAILQPILKADRSSADAWWLLANALTDPSKQIQALNQVLKLRPNDDRAGKMLGRLQAEQRAKEDAFSFPVSDEDPFASASSHTSMGSFSSASSGDDDPFGSVSSDEDPFASDAEPVGSGDPFASSSADPFKRSAGEKSKRSTVSTIVGQTQKKQDNPVVMILAIIGVFALGCCVISAVLVSRGAVEIGNVFQQIVLTITADPNFSFQEGGGSGGRIDADARNRGTIAIGQSITNTVDTFDDDYYTLTLDRSETITINVVERDGDLDPQLYVLDSNRAQIAQNDDISMADNNMNSRLTISLSPGTYYLLVSAFGTGGRYEISISR